ncbi:hypothetical protein BT67DRAFT_443458 [Trichocladium antarcticum]|uniref:Uncharacterized protein n=1 Tax=Trichocladium antarcticum TaxID=1450529 RepID=A0AAN6ZC29_9PEZI|nr:hypothetical protein BT67DRAFT_443458 [Trichocladium antarcticum]
MPTKDSEKTYESKATTMAKASVPTQPVSVGDSDNRYYTCVCKLCICGGAVDYPGDICDICSKYH